MRRDQRCVGSSHGDDPAEGREREKLNKPGSMYKMLSLGLFCLYQSKVTSAEAMLAGLGLKAAGIEPLSE